MTFKKGLGLSLYYDAQLRSMDNTGSPVPDTNLVDTDKNLLIGRNIEGPPYQYAAFDMASFTVFQEYLHEDDVNRVFLFFWSGSKWSILLRNNFSDTLGFSCNKQLFDKNFTSVSCEKSSSTGSIHHSVPVVRALAFHL